MKTIGESAGVIWSHLSEKGDLPLKTLAKQVNIDTEVSRMALGWLAREDKVRFSQRGKGVLVQLKNGENGS